MLSALYPYALYAANPISTSFTPCMHLRITLLCSFSQIQKILTMYTPGDFEGKVPSSLIRLIGERCRQRDGSVGQQLLVHTDDSLLTPYATANGVHSTETVNNLRSLSTPNSMMLDQLLIKIWPNLCNLLLQQWTYFELLTSCQLETVFVLSSALILIKCIFIINSRTWSIQLVQVGMYSDSLRTTTHSYACECSTFIRSCAIMTLV